MATARRTRAISPPWCVPRTRWCEFVHACAHARLFFLPCVLGPSSWRAAGCWRLRVQDDNTRTSHSSDGVVLPFKRTDMQEPPLEQHLVQNALWPETQKLYGHGFELMSLETNHAGTLFVSTCKATAPEHAVLHVWKTSNWQPAYTLPGHKLTVTRTAFSPDDEWLVSASRDRQICVYKRSGERSGGDGAGGAAGGSVPAYTLVQTILKAHDRIIWDLSWTPDGTHFVSASRDKTAKVWSLLPTVADGGGAGSDDGAGAVAWAASCTTPKLPGSVTALDVAPRLFQGDYVLAAGLENGQLHLFKFGAQEITPLYSIDRRLCPGLTVQRLRWRVTGDAPPDAGTPSHWKAQFACGSDDMSVRILDVAIQL